VATNPTYGRERTDFSLNVTGLVVRFWFDDFAVFGSTFVRQSIFLVKPSAQVNQPATLAAEWWRRGFSELEATPAGAAGQFRGSLL